MIIINTVFPIGGLIAGIFAFGMSGDLKPLTEGPSMLSDSNHPMSTFLRVIASVCTCAMRHCGLTETTIQTAVYSKCTSTLVQQN